MKKIINRFFKENRGGSEITQSLLLIGVALSLVLTIFYPGIKTAFSKVAGEMDNWLADSASEVFGLKVKPGEQP